MKKCKKRMFIPLFFFFMMMGMILVGTNVEAASIKYQGTSGTLRWSIDSNGHFLLTGNGDYDPFGYHPDTITIEGVKIHDGSYPIWCKYRKEIKSATVKVTGITMCIDMFWGCENLTSVNLSGLDTSDVTMMGGMFEFCTKLTKLDLSGFDVSNVGSMSSMFGNCKALQSINMKSWNFTNAVYCGGMFSNCDRLKYVDLSCWKTTQPFEANAMFLGCDSLQYVNLGSVQFSNVIGMFEYSKSLKCVDMSRSKLTGDLVEKDEPFVSLVFGDCPSLEVVNLPIDAGNNSILLPKNGTWRVNGTGSVYTCIKGKNRNYITVSTKKVVPTKWTKINGTWFATNSYGMPLYVTGLYKIGGKYSYVVNGKLSTATTLVKYNNQWWYVKNGVLCTDTTLVKYNGKFYYVSGGKISKDNTLVKYGNYYWYVSGGTLKTATTLVKYKGRYYFVYRGRVNFNYTGTYVWNGVRWKIVKGVVVGKA